MTYTQIGSNIQPVETPTESGTNLTMFFNSGNNITLTFPPSVAGESFLRAEVFGGGTTNNSSRQVSFDTDSDKEIVLSYGIEP